MCSEYFNLTRNYLVLFFHFIADEKIVANALITYSLTFIKKGRTSFRNAIK